jgi:predicted RNase H-like HicB family nuclease
MKPAHLINIVWKEGKYFVAQCLNVEVSSFGKSYEESLENLEEALDLYFEDNPSPSIRDIKFPSITLSKKQYA